jgi:hypothetical protein
MACFVCLDGLGDHSAKAESPKRAGEKRCHLNLLDAADYQCNLALSFFSAESAFYLLCMAGDSSVFCHSSDNSLLEAI